MKKTIYPADKSPRKPVLALEPLELEPQAPPSDYFLLSAVF